MFNSLGWVNSILLGSPVVWSPPFNLWTGMFCSISSADDGTVFILFYKDSSDSGVTGVLIGRSVFVSTYWFS